MSFIGISFNSKRNIWQAYVGIPGGSKGKKLYLGQFDTELNAALYREKFLSVHKENKSKRNNISQHLYIDIVLRLDHQTEVSEEELDKFNPYRQEMNKIS